jgi:UDP-N-acetylglucosamine--N-acetylmuramyl-(pentapeptide) pyrophosphoryl-undecaprenol N-acetylglucosamine transferase
MNKTALIMAGGTGGHIYPGLALAETLVSHGWTIHWQGTAKGMEHRLVAPAGYPMHTVEMTGVRGKGLLRWLALPLRLARACWQARAILQRVRPHLVVGIGGYMSVPGGIMARLTGRPLVILEPGAVAGIANRFLAHFATRVLVGFPDAFNARIESRVARLIAPPKRVDWSGVPLRGSITTMGPPAARYAKRTGPLRLLVVGGSLGAQTLNDLVVAALAMIPASERPQVTHQSGEANHDALKAAYAKAQVEAQVVPYIHEMAAAYVDCDLLICRAGAITVAEIAAAGVAALLVPLPWNVGDEQRANAQFLADRGAGAWLDQRTTRIEDLAERIRRTTRAELTTTASAAYALGRRDASSVAAQICTEVAV